MQALTDPNATGHSATDFDDFWSAVVAVVLGLVAIGAGGSQIATIVGTSNTAGDYTFESVSYIPGPGVILPTLGGLLLAGAVLVGLLTRGRARS